jgi:flagellar basal-body rod protein FlgB
MVLACPLVEYRTRANQGERLVVSFAGIDAADVLLGAMKAAELNHRYIANNIANADTPNYTPVHLDFQKTLRAAIEGRGGITLRTSRPRHLDYTQHRPQFERLAFLSKNDYNKVDLDDQIAKLSDNTGQYVAYSALLTKRFDQTKTMLNDLKR